MEQKLNIAEILKDKPQGTKLYADAFGELSIEKIYIGDKEDKDELGITLLSSVGDELIFYNDGRYTTQGESILVPSKEMRDWEKFSWKRGDVLISDCGFVCIFKEWASDDYTKFNGCYFDGMPNAETAKYSKLDNNTAYGYIREIENRCGGKLNLETLKIEKQNEFKDGDIVTMHKKYCDIVFIFNRLRTEGSFYYYAFHTLQTNNTGVIDCHITLPCAWTFFEGKMNFATDSEKQQLFGALAKEGNAWDADKKMIVYLKPKYEFKPMDLCLMKYIGQYNNRGWELCQYAYTEHRVSSSGEHRDFYHAVGGEIYAECIPYNEDTKHLLGTKDKWKGGEG